LEEVSKIDEELIVRLIDPIIPNNPKNEINAEWGVARIQAEACWASGLNGTGAVVGFIDTGVRRTHIDLASNYYGTYGWFDTVTNSDSLLMIMVMVLMLLEQLVVLMELAWLQVQNGWLVKDSVLTELELKQDL